MMLNSLTLIGILVVVSAAVVAAVTLALRTYLRYRGERLVTCPETHLPAAVRVNATKAAGKRILGKVEVRLDECSRWPEKENCGQDCLSQVNADPEQCLVWNIVADWYKGKSCAYCQKPFGQIHWHDRPPAVLSHERITKQWNEIPPEKLPETFETHLPVCWNCYIAETFRRQHPDLIVDRRWERGAGGEYIPKS